MDPGYGDLMDSQESLFVQTKVSELLDAGGGVNFAYSSFHSGPGQQTFGPERRMRADLAVSSGAPGSTVLTFYNYHGNLYHNGGLCTPDCPGGSGSWADDERSRATRQADRLKRRYAAALSEAGGSLGLTVEYESVGECWLTHSGIDRRAALAARPGSVLGVGRRRFSIGRLLGEVLGSERNSSGSNSFGGFLTVTGGKESPSGLPPEDVFGFCHQRCKVGRGELGDFTLAEVDRTFGASGADAALRRMENTYQTFSRKSFHSEGETVSLDYLRFLVEERGFRGFRVKHFLFFRHKGFLDEFVTGLLQQRRDVVLSKEGDPAERNLRSGLLKLVLNGESRRKEARPSTTTSLSLQGSTDSRP